MSTPSSLAELTRIHRNLAQRIRSRLAEFDAVQPSEYFYELAYCLLTPQSSAVNADAVVADLRSAGFLEHGIDPEPLLRDPAHYIRFHRVKSLRLLEARTRLSETMRIILADPGPVELRRQLVEQVNGFGLKEATHFMRNIGKSGGLAILDRHILRNLKRFGAIRSIPPTLTTKHYLSIERRFDALARKIGIPIEELDLVFWSMETGEIRK